MSYQLAMLVGTDQWDAGNVAPEDIALSNSSINERAGANAVVGNLSTVDANVGDTHVYTLVSGTGATDNALFNISGTSLRATSSLNYADAATRSVRIRSTDQHGEFVEEVFTITVNFVFNTTGLAGYWKMADLTDASGNGFTLTNNNSVTFAANASGTYVGNYASIVSATSKYLSLADNDAFSFAGETDWTICLWAYLDSSPAANRGFIGKAAAYDAASYEWGILLSSSHIAQSLISNGTTDSFLQATNFGALSTGTWYFIAVRHDAANNLNKIRINTTDQSTTWTGNSFNSNRPITFGGRTPGAGLIDGRMSRVMITRRQLSDAELTYLYNGGVGRDAF